MNSPELMLHHQRLEQRIAQVRAQVARLQAELAHDPAAERLDEDRAATEAARRDIELRLREREREAADRRSRLQGRERELMSGRVRNPTELMKLNQEVEHLRAAVVEEEDAQFELMEEQEGLEAELVRLGAELEVARQRTATAAPQVRARLERLEAELPELEAERDATWERIPADWQRAYARVRSRTPDPIAVVSGGQCQGCRVGVTSSGMQVLRRGGLLQCDNCGRILLTE